MASLNEMLADLVSAWNALLAGFIVLVFVLIGAVFATLTCGALAIFIDIRRLLKKIVEADASAAS
ncbi:hypothetical protein ACSHT0_05475 [Tepidicaulis sp. LMO-SS28]|uniref:hypothetical protein n=1 Tax=Tepidicaulis sp. LMO-SS28 TaxID=3447455 RepID=UPI003EE1DD2C